MNNYTYKHTRVKVKMTDKIFTFRKGPKKNMIAIYFALSNTSRNYCNLPFFCYRFVMSYIHVVCLVCVRNSFDVISYPVIREKRFSDKEAIPLELKDRFYEKTSNGCCQWVYFIISKSKSLNQILSTFHFPKIT